MKKLNKDVLTKIRIVFLVGLIVIGMVALAGCGGGGSSSSDGKKTNTSPVSQIITPTKAESFSSGDMIQFTGSGTDNEDGDLTGASLVWSSDVDGKIGTGKTFASETLSIGNHQITLTVKDAEGATGTDTIGIKVSANTPPVAQIITPIEGASFSTGDMIQFTGSGTDNEDGDLTGASLVWSSDVDGKIGTGKTFASETLSIGNHQVTLSVTDAKGGLGMDTIGISINTNNLNQALLGPLAGAEIRAYRLTDLNNPIEGPITANDSLYGLEKAGTFTLELSDIPDDEWILVTASGGLDIDADDDSIVNDPLIQNGTIYALATASQWRNGGCNINVITDIIYSLYKTDDATDICHYLNQIAQDLINDVSNDGSVNYDDALLFNPRLHKEFFKLGINELQNIASQIRYGLSEYDRDIYYGSLYSKIVNHGSLDSNTVTDENSGITVTTTVQNNIKTINVLNIDTTKRIETNIYQSAGSPFGRSEIQYKGHVLTIDYHVDDPSLLSQTAADLIDAKLMNVKLIEIQDGSVQVQIPKELIESIADNGPAFRFDGILFSPTIIQDDPVIGWYFVPDLEDILSSLELKKEDLSLEFWAKCDNHEIKLADGVKLPCQFTLTPRLYSNGVLLSQQDVENSSYCLNIDIGWFAEGEGLLVYRYFNVDEALGSWDFLFNSDEPEFSFSLSAEYYKTTDGGYWDRLNVIGGKYKIHYDCNLFSGFGSASDPSGDAYEYLDSHYGPSADLIGAIITVNGDQANFSVSYSAGTFDSKLSGATFVLDTDQNPNTGFPGVDSNGNDDGFIGAEYILQLGPDGCENYGAYVLEYTGTFNKFNEVGSFYLKPSTNGFSIDLPLSILEDDGRMNFKVLSSARIDGTCYYQGCVDYMPDLGLPATEVW